MSKSTIKKFRNSLYNIGGKRKDALFNLLDAVTSSGHKTDSIVGLSDSNEFEREYSSIQDAISIGAADVNWQQAQALVYGSCTVSSDINCIYMDVTNNPRPFARTLTDRSFVHAPNPAPGNKPVCVGHGYSTLAMLPNDLPAQGHRWLVPLDVERVPSDKKGNELGVDQLISTLENLDINHKFTVSVGDSLYSTEYCRVTATNNDNVVHISRLNSKRNVYAIASSDDQSPDGRKKIYGHKMQLNQPETHLEPDYTVKIEIVTARGKKQYATISTWNDILLRGSKSYKAKEYAFTLVRVELTHEDGSCVFKRPLWLAASGKRRTEITPEKIYSYYRSRYDIEHLFRFKKNNLLATAYQTPDTYHEELWWKIVMLAYVQLFLSKDIVRGIPKAWEKYLPEYKNQDEGSIATPSQTQRGFSLLLNAIGTPALPCIPRGRSAGRAEGETQHKRACQEIVCKSSKKQKNQQSEKSPKSSNPKETQKLLQSVTNKLKKLGVAKEEFVKMLL